MCQLVALEKMTHSSVCWEIHYRSHCRERWRTWGPELSPRLCADKNKVTSDTRLPLAVEGGLVIELNDYIEMMEGLVKNSKLEQCMNTDLSDKEGNWGGHRQAHSTSELAEGAMRQATRLTQWPGWLKTTCVCTSLTVCKHKKLSISLKWKRSSIYLLTQSPTTRSLLTCNSQYLLGPTSTKQFMMVIHFSLSILRLRHY